MSIHQSVQAYASNQNIIVLNITTHAWVSTSEHAIVSASSTHLTRPEVAELIERLQQALEEEGN